MLFLLVSSFYFAVVDVVAGMPVGRMPVSVMGLACGITSSLLAGKYRCE